LSSRRLRVFESTELERIEDHTAYTRGGKITADHIIIAVDKLNSTISLLAGEIFHAQTFMSMNAPGRGEQSADERFLTKCS
jgi:glycine/D-amino acid oxidase-like deaminating enzyme